jgi:hypothetical protein
MTPAMRLRLLSKRQEASIAKDLGGRVTPASGAIKNPRLKSDVTSKHFRVEAKLTSKGSYSLSLPILDKIEREALINNQIPVLATDIQGQKYATLRWDDFIALAHDAKLL